jgi:CRISPR-associated endonuclease/helicase Cas3
MSGLHTRFAEFYEAIHGVTPFPWQVRLADRVANGESWPEWLALPTATGKTACIDIAVFALACQVNRPPARRTSPRRIFFVIDRRVVVDQAFERARKLAERLEGAATGVVAEVAESLRRIGAGSRPLQAFQLRGGIYRDEAWARSPLQPMVIASTVDQVGSRILFRGYGLRGGFDWPIHAALTTNDALIILDEAHCSEPFRQTVDACLHIRSQSEAGLRNPFHVCVMSATPPALAAEPFVLLDEDRADPILSKRLGAGKPARLVEGPAVRGATGDRRFAQAVADQAWQLGQAEPRAVGVIVNRVATATAVFELLAAKAPNATTLLTGRMRPLDRDAVVQGLADLETGASRQALTSTRFVVATQCLEVGADLDFDALVTECASLGALRQRFGRLNRGGRDIASEAAIVIRGDQIQAADDKVDPIYGASLPRTWEWLKAVSTNDRVDFGVTALDTLLESIDRRQFEAPAADAPVMLPAYLDGWVQTSPAPAPDPDVGIFLHGPKAGPADVLVCFRADLCVDVEHAQIPVAVADAVDVLAACPPTSVECLPVPLVAVRRWLRSQDAPAGADILAVETPGEEEEKPSADRVHFGYAWRGVEDTALLSGETAGGLRPGDVLVVPLQVSGWNRLGHVPHGRLNGVDVGDMCHVQLRLRPVIRLSGDLAVAWGPGAATVRDADPAQLEEPSIRRWLSQVAADAGLESWRRVVAECLRADRNRVVVAHPAGGLLIRSSRVPSAALRTRLRAAFSARVSEDLLTGEDDSAAATVQVSLDAHLRGVTETARGFCDALGLPDAIVEDVCLAASLHDIGKADPRFQAWLRGGRWFLGGLALLGKSDGMPGSVRERREARERAGYPRGGRHELLSAKLAEVVPSLLATAHDRELVLHLIASHHGRCRPFAPVIDDPDGGRHCCEIPALGVSHAGLATGLERLDGGVADRFWSLNSRYGSWALAWLETVLRLADRIRSEAEQLDAVTIENDEEENEGVA